MLPTTLRVIAIIFAITLALTVSSADACACGIYIPHDGEASIAQEQVVLRWDGRTEDIIMTLDVLGASKEAAVILPVPARASVKLGDGKLFPYLRDYTKPLVVTEKRYQLFPPLGLGAAAPPETGARPVSVLDRQQLGPFDVATLAATDAQALSGWLKTNGFALSPRIADTLQVYVAKGWFYVAVRLTPGASSTLTGSLDPLFVTFDSSVLIYPMRPSAAATQPETVAVYVLAAHRMDKAQNFGGSHINFADWVDPTKLASDSPLAPLVTQKTFLTKFTDTVNPAQVNDDFVFTPVAQDQIYHDTITAYEDDYTPFFALLFGCACLVIALLGFAGWGVFKLIRRGQKASSLAS